ncbi:hypothetical protein [Solitalea lacus]|uniref:hypothetical protein n=1 Tax=Solitalea lacus TaxID=2911172 RepID=UPI001EDBA7AE|nr:hypothetical protein [Solitalea lacus]UKJ09178.1 hypothetical protein L2B55_08475 [Solitalea lacus]
MTNQIVKRVVVVHWKNKAKCQWEVFSNLKNFCLSYPEYNYNTLNNYLSKAKTAYENDTVRIERKPIISQPKMKEEVMVTRQIMPVVNRVAMSQAKESTKDLDYWLSQPTEKRIEAVTFIISQSLKKGESMNKAIINKQLMKP